LVENLNINELNSSCCFTCIFNENFSKMIVAIHAVFNFQLPQFEKKILYVHLVKLSIYLFYFEVISRIHKVNFVVGTLILDCILNNIILLL